MLKHLHVWKRKLRVWQRATFRYGAADLRHAFERLMEFRPAILFVHSSLSRCGFMRGGPPTLCTVLQSLTDVLVLPTHTYCYPQPNGDPGEIFDPAHTASRVGAISDWFWRQPENSRSLHPSHSLSSQTQHSASLLENHDLCTTPCGAGSPYARLVEADAAVMMFGCNMNTYTLFHTAEDAAGCSYLYCDRPVSMRIKGPAGLRTLSIQRQNMEVPRRFVEAQGDLQEAGLLKCVRFGAGEIIFIPHAQRVHEFLLHKLTRDPRFLLKSS